MSSSCIFSFCNCPITPNGLIAVTEALYDTYNDVPTMISSETYNIVNGVMTRLTIYQYAPMAIMVIAIVWILWYYRVIDTWPALIISIVFLGLFYAFVIAYQASVSDFLNHEILTSENTIEVVIKQRFPGFLAKAFVAYSQAIANATIPCGSKELDATVDPNQAFKPCRPII